MWRGGSWAGFRSAVVLGVCVLAFAPAGGATRTSTRPVAKPATRVAVKLVDFRILLSRTVVPPGRVTFDVVNSGAVGHDIVFAAGGTRVLQPGEKQTIDLVFSKSGIYRYYCSVPGHRALGMAGEFRVGPGAPPPATKPTTPRAPSTGATPPEDLQLTQVASGLGPLTFAVSPPGDDSRLMLVQQDGLVLLVKDGTLQPTPFLDLRPVVRANGEQGLLSIAFAPDYETSGLFYAYYNDLGGNVHIDEFERSPDDADTADPNGREVLSFVKPAADHNGGMMQFGPDGDLYIAVGDGGANPPTIPVGAYGQTLDDLFGSILRIDPRGGVPYAIPPGNPFVGVPGDRPEIVAYGLRNPWRFWIDPQTNSMLIGDVGESSREEIDRLPLDDLGLNFGWPCQEGTITPDVIIPPSCATATLTPPLYEYGHSPTRCSIIGGVVARDPRLPGLDGQYLWTDLCDGTIYTIDPSAMTIDAHSLGISVPKPTSFGEDADGRIYVTTATGDVYRIDPAAAPTSS